MANKFAIGLVLCGAVTGLCSPIIKNISANIPAADAPSMTNREYEKALTDAMEINRKEFARQKAADEAEVAEASISEPTYSTEVNEMNQYARERGLAYAEAAREKHGW